MSPLNSPTPTPLVSVIIATKNEENNIIPCLESIRQQSYLSQNIETIVVDNFSTDKTCEFARRFTDKVYLFGPERSAQRNLGMIEKAQGHYLMYVDADMVLSPRLVERCVERMGRGDCIALHIPEIVLGVSFWSRVRRFERLFYDGTVIDGARFFDKKTFHSVSGFDEELYGAEDWDLDKKLKQKGSIVLLKTPFAIGQGGLSWGLSGFVRDRGVNPEAFGEVIFHNEADFYLGRYLQKKRYYSTNFQRYISKWGSNDPDLQKQFGWRYRYITVFFNEGKWMRLLFHPLMAMGMFFLRGAVGIVFLWSSFKNDR